MRSVWRWAHFSEIPRYLSAIKRQRTFPAKSHFKCQTDKTAAIQGAVQQTVIRLNAGMLFCDSVCVCVGVCVCLALCSIVCLCFLTRRPRSYIEGCLTRKPKNLMYDDSLIYLLFDNHNFKLDLVSCLKSVQGLFPKNLMWSWSVLPYIEPLLLMRVCSIHF